MGTTQEYKTCGMQWSGPWRCPGPQDPPAHAALQTLAVQGPQWLRPGVRRVKLQSKYCRKSLLGFIGGCKRFLCNLDHDMPAKKGRFLAASMEHRCAGVFVRKPEAKGHQRIGMCARGPGDQSGAGLALAGLQVVLTRSGHR